MKISWREIRNKMYSSYDSELILSRLDVDPNNWKKNPYTFLKSRYYIEIGTILIYFLFNTSITANSITLTYVALAPIAAIMISINNNIAIAIGIFIFFNRSILDWIDGFWARNKNQTSYKGAILDSYGAKIGTISFNVGIGIFCFNHSGNITFLFLIIFLLFLHSNMIREYSSSLILRDITNNLVDAKISSNKNPNKANFAVSKKYLNFISSSLLNFFYNILDGRARSIDTILLLMIIDMNFKTELLNFVFILIIIRSSMHFIGDFYIFNDGKWIENFKQKDN